MSRAAIAGVRELVDLSRVGQFSLPTELTRNYEACLKIQSLHLGPLELVDVDRAAESIVAAAMRGDPIDLSEIGRQIEGGNAIRAAVQAASLAKRAAEERAGDQLATIAADLTEVIIVECLRPAFESTLEQAREPAQLVHSHPVSPQDLRLKDSNEIRAIRSAMRQLEPLGQRRAAIMQARSRANQLGQQKPQHDSENRFATLRRPLALSPGWRPPAKFPSPQIPQGQLEALVWFVIDGQVCEPWMPTTQEQDQAWLTVFGEWFNQQKAAASAWPRVVSN